MWYVEQLSVTGYVTGNRVWFGSEREATEYLRTGDNGWTHTEPQRSELVGEVAAVAA